MTPKPLWFPVTKEDREGMKEGNEVMKHYHDVVFPDDTVAVIVGMPFDRKKYNYLLPRGIDIIPIELTEEQIDRLEKEAILSRSTGPHNIPVEVHVVDAEELGRARKL